MAQGSEFNPYQSPQQYAPMAGYPGAPPRAPKSGVVTAVAMINFIYGGLNMFCGVLLSVLGIFLAQILPDAAINQGNMNPREAKQLAMFQEIGGSIMAALGVIFVLAGVLTVIAGVGVLKRRNWGRVLSISVAALCGVLAIVQLLFAGLTAVVPLAYCIFTLVILLQQQYAAEFR